MKEGARRLEAPRFSPSNGARLSLALVQEIRRPLSMGRSREDEPPIILSTFSQLAM